MTNNKKGYKLKTHLKTIYIPYTLQNYPAELILLQNEFNYAIQTEIF